MSGSYVQHVFRASLATVLLSPSLFAELLGDAPMTPTPTPARLSFAEEERLAKGWIATFRTGEQLVDARRVRLAALWVPEGTSPTPFLPPGKFAVDLTGSLHVELGGPVSLVLGGHGSATISVNGVKILEGRGDLSKLLPANVQLHTGHNSVRIEYLSPVHGDSELEIQWAGRDFFLEPLQPSQLFHDPESPLMLASAQRRRGRELIGTLSCNKCHAGHLPSGTTNVAPELAKDNPRLMDVGSRLTMEWMFHWILDPRNLHNEATMPVVLTDNDRKKRQQQAADIAAFLTTVTDGVTLDEKPTGSDRALIDAGELLFEQLGCIGCHRFSPPIDEDVFSRISLFYTHSKYREHRLVDFLIRPHRYYDWNRMPDFQLSQREATVLAAFVRNQSKGRLETPSVLARARPEQGRRTFREAGCANCHQIGPDLIEPTVRVAWHDVPDDSDGCLAAEVDGRGTAPEFFLSREDREALVGFLRDDLPSLSRVVPVEAAERLINRLRCTVCHRRDGEFNQLDDVILEESVVGLPPEAVPHLTWVGEKLHRDWSQRFMAGRIDYRPRPWLHIRMPEFPVHSRLLAIGLEEQHGIPQAQDRLSPQAAEPDPALALIGERLSRQPPQGFFCTECHAVGDKPPAGAFDHKGVNLAHAAERLHRDFYMRWITAPQRIDPGSKMPTLSPDGRTTQIGNVLGGDAQRQFDALWNYLLSLKGSYTADNAAHTSPTRTEGVSMPQ